ncbi:MAG: HAMP domain-containing histidine kinase [Deltaproteobacteria bacterium]|nr:HAMP domain-containing histidine kinase [Deltaproteobacteria bacterium]
MKPLSSLFAKIFLWFFLNLALVSGVLIVFYSLQSRLDLYTILRQQASDRMRIASRLIAHDLHQEPRTNWPDVLARHGRIYQVDFALVPEFGEQVRPENMHIPKAVIKMVTDAFPKPPPGGFPPLPVPLGSTEHEIDRLASKVPGPPDQEIGRRPPPEQHPVPLHEPRLMIRTKNPTQYWVGVPMMVFPQPSAHPRPAVLLAVSSSITGNGFFFDPYPWMIVAASVILVSVLFWIPLVRNITRPLARMTRATEEIAGGRFDVRIHEPRSDEIGRLGSAINHMTSRLCGLVKGQKRFLGDVAHELGSPIARLQLGISILERNVDPANRERVADVVEDVTHISNLVNELLSFSRAEMNPGRVRLETTKLLPLVQRAVQRESTPGAEALARIDPDLSVVADPELLTRALANLIRNAVKYAGDAGPICVSAERTKDGVEIEVRDSGQGVPEGLLDHLFEPFFRPEPSRDRESGGVGLGLAIVKTCIETCKGTVSARNLKPQGFAVTITLADTC